MVFQLASRVLLAADQETALVRCREDIVDLIIHGAKWVYDLVIHVALEVVDAPLSATRCGRAKSCVANVELLLSRNLDAQAAAGSLGAVVIPRWHVARSIEVAATVWRCVAKQT